MIQASELRIGNYLNFTFMGLTEVYSVFEFTHNNVKITEDTQYQISMVSGIPLTEELLLKMGFEYFEWDSKWQKGDIQIDTDDGLSYYILIASITRVGKAIQYVHELQNAVYLLCDQELTLS